MAKFLNILSSDEIGIYEGRTVHKLTKELIWENDPIRVTIPVDFETDLASVPRVPIAYLLWGDRAHREAVLHDFLYRIDSVIQIGDGYADNIKREDADWYFRVAMKGQGNPWRIYHFIWLGIRLGGKPSFHRMKVMDHFQIEREN